MLAGIGQFRVYGENNNPGRNYMFKHFALFSFILLFSSLAIAEEIKLDAQATNVLKSNLEKLVGKKVSIRTESSDEISGTVQSVGNEAVVLAQLTGREFFDAIVPMDKVQAIIVRSR